MKKQLAMHAKVMMATFKEPVNASIIMSCDHVAQDDTTDNEYVVDAQAIVKVLLRLPSRTVELVHDLLGEEIKHS